MPVKRLKPGEATFATFALGDELARNVKFWISDLFGKDTVQDTGSNLVRPVDDLPSMLIGCDLLLSHHMMVLFREHKLLFTYNGGPIFQTVAQGPPAQPIARVTVLGQLPHAHDDCESSESSLRINDGCGCSSMVELQLPKLLTWVRFPSPAPLCSRTLSACQLVGGQIHDIKPAQEIVRDLVQGVRELFGQRVSK